jgi:GNAT superfamily N-acetyltransferase
MVGSVLVESTALRCTHAFRAVADVDPLREPQRRARDRRDVARPDREGTRLELDQGADDAVSTPSGHQRRGRDPQCRQGRLRHHEIRRGRGAPAAARGAAGACPLRCRRTLVDWLEGSARVAGIARISLEARFSNVDARNFYSRLGYSQAELLPGYYGGREASVRMAKELGSTQKGIA